MSWSTEKPTEPGLYWWRWGAAFKEHDANYVVKEGGEIVRLWLQPGRVDTIWWVSHFGEGVKHAGPYAKVEKTVELQFTAGEWWSERIIGPAEQAAPEAHDMTTCPVCVEWQKTREARVP